MVVYVSDEEKVYTLKDGLDNSNWVIFESVIMGGEFNKIVLTPQPPTNPTSEIIWINRENGKLYYRNPDNTEWETEAEPQIDGGDF